MTTTGRTEGTQHITCAGSIAGSERLKWLALLPFLLVLTLSIPLRAVTENVTYNTVMDVPITAASYTATGSTINFTLNFAPPLGTNLAVIHLTGLGFIQGTFDNLPQGKLVALSYGGQTYYFMANYNGHTGRDLVLQWANMLPLTWGANASGQVGDGSTSQANGPVAVDTRGAFWGKAPSSAAAGGNHSIGLCLDGTVAAWGSNTYGQLGINSTTQSSVPAMVTISGVPSTRRVVAVAAGASHSLALCSDGTLWSWGLNNNGQLGNNGTSNSLVPVAVTTSSGALSGKSVVAIAAGGNHSLALCSDGTVAAWGLNTSGQLGNSIPTQSLVPVAVTTSSGALSGKSVIAVAAGGSHSLALCSDYTVAAWGLNTNGQLGNGTTSQSTVPVAVSTTGVLNGKSVIAIAAGGSHSLALCSNYTVVAWGLNSSGQLGDNTTSQRSMPVAVMTGYGALSGKSVIHIAAGANHSLAYCMDGNFVSTLASWGANGSGQLGNNNNPTNSTVPVQVNVPGAYWQGVFSGVASGSSANHTLSLVSLPEVEFTGYGIQKQVTYSQVSAAAPALEPDEAYMFSCYVSRGTMGSLLTSSTLTPPVGSTGSAGFLAGSNGLQLQANYTTKSAMDAEFTAGNYYLTIRTSTPNTYNAQLTLGADNYPAIPRIVSLTNATWNNGALKVTDYTQDVTITWNSPGTANTYFRIDNTDINSGFGAPATSYTISGGALQNDSSYRGTIQFSNSTSGFSIPGLIGVSGNVGYTNQVEFSIVTGTASALSSPAMYLLLKNHVLLQTSNAAPVDGPANLPYSDQGPYSLTAQSPVGGAVAGPASLSIPLFYHPDSSGSEYRSMSDPYLSLAALSAACPNGTYTFPGSVSVSLTGDSYPAGTQITSVNGATPVWNAQGQLALDPTIDNTIAWTPVIVPNWSTMGHQGVFFESYSDSSFNNIDIETGVLGNSPDPITSLTIPKFSMTASYTYVGDVSYVSAPTATPVGDAYAVAGYQSGTAFVAVALKPQTITFGPIANQNYPSAAFALGATASSGLPVTYAVMSGPATIAGNMVTLTGTGTVTIQATQNGNGVYASAVPVTQAFTVGTTTKLMLFRTNNGLAADGSQDLLTPAHDGVPNLLKFAFRMIGTGEGQASSLTIPNVQVLSASGTAGLPRMGVDGSGRLTLTYIRRTAANNSGVAYAVEFTSDLSSGSWSVNPSAIESVTAIDANFERVTVTDSVAGGKRFARVRVSEL